MHLSFSILVLATMMLDLTLAQPLHRVHKRLHRLDLAAVLKEKRQNWNDPSLYKGVDWSKVNYGKSGASVPAPVSISKAAPAPAPAPASTPAPATKPVSTPASPLDPAAQASVAPKKLSAAPVTNSNTGFGKRGLAYNPSSPNLNIFAGYDKLTWGYNWDSTRQNLPSNFQYVPMLFSNAKDKTDAWPDAVNAATSGPGTHYLLAFNEPDMASTPTVGGSGMDVGSAVAAYKHYMNPHASGNVKLGAPAVSSSENPGQGLDNWLKPFLQQCSGCVIDFIPVHWYGSDANIFKSHIQKAMSYAEGKSVWVTEFQCQSGDESAFLAAVLPWLDEQAGVGRYSYFMASGKSLTNGNAVSAVGQKYGSA